MHISLSYMQISLCWDIAAQLAMEINFLEHSKDKETLLGRKSESQQTAIGHRGQQRPNQTANGEKSKGTFLPS